MDFWAEAGGDSESEHLKKCVGVKGGHLVCPELWVVWHLASGLYLLNTFDKEGGCVIN